MAHSGITTAQKAKASRAARAAGRPPLLSKKERRRAAGWAPAFLSTLRASGNFGRAAAKAGISRQYLYDYRELHPKFKKQWDDAMETACDRLELVAWRRAKESSDRLLILLLRAYRPERFREHVQIDIETTIRQFAEAEGIDPDEAVAEAQKIVRKLE